MSDLVPFPTPAVKTDETFGGCPHCGTTGGYLNAGRGHFFFCDTHQTFWFAGCNLFSDWREETLEEQEAKWKRIETYTKVEPIYAADRAASAGDEVPLTTCRTSKEFGDILDGLFGEDTP